MSDNGENGILNDRDSGWLACVVERHISAHYQAAGQKYNPSFMVQPRLFLDGDKWCALFGDDLQSGVCGFGDSPSDAYSDFDKSWFKKVGEK